MVKQAINRLLKALKKKKMSILKGREGIDRKLLF